MKGEVAQRNRRRGKRIESSIAREIGGKRVGILGKADVEHDRFMFEVKSRKAFVAVKWMEQAVKNAKDKIPAVVVHILGKRHENDLVIMRLEDFKKELLYKESQNE